MSRVEIRLPRKIHQAFSQPRGALRYRCFFGGRGSGKSFNVAKMAAIWGYVEPLRILCTREFQNSIRESFYAELRAAIASEPFLADAYEITNEYIRGKNGTEFIFKGLRNNIQSIKSLSKIDVCIVEEAEDISESAWEVLEPTIRAPRSEIWVIWNPKHRNSATDTRFRQNMPPRACVVAMNYDDNPFFPDALDELRRYQRTVLDPARYAWIWEGAYYEQSQAQVFAGKYQVRDFEPEPCWGGAYFGLDFGFANDPTAAVQCYVYEGCLWVYREAGGKGIELDEMVDCLKRSMPSVERYTIRADSARPESISYLRRHGLPRIVAVEKGKGSVESGVEFIKSFERVYVHPSCKQTLNELHLYSYKTDRLSGDVLPVLVDAFNHWMDALRYALQPLIKQYGEPRRFDFRL